MLNSFYQNRNLIFQFYLRELILISKDVFLLSSKELPNNLLKSTFKVLAAPYQEPFHYSPWNTEIGVLLKIKQLVTALSEISTSPSAPLISMDKLTTQLWKKGLDILHSLYQIEKQIDPAFTQGKLRKKIEEFINIFRQLSDQTAETLKDFASNENIMFFILRNQQAFEAIFGTGFVKNLILESYPDGIEQAGKLLKNKFIKRGFLLAAEQLATKCQELI